MTDPTPAYALTDRTGRVVWVATGRQAARDAGGDDELEIVPGTFTPDPADGGKVDR